MYCYYAHGLIVESEFALPGALPLQGDHPGPAALTLHNAEAAAPDRARHLGPYSYTEDCIHFAAGDVAQIACHNDGRIAVQPAEGCDETALSALLIATALPIQFWWRGDLVLQAAGVILPGQVTVTAIAGPGGAGKSTLVAQCLAAGAELVGDDTLRLWRSPRGWVVAGLSGGYFHRAPDGSRQFTELPQQRPVPARPLGRMLALALPRGDRPQVSTLTGSEALTALLDSRHRPELPQLLGRAEAQLPSLAGLSASLPITRWQRAEGEIALQPAEQAILFG